jgi:hypothetical protein
MTDCSRAASEEKPAHSRSIQRHEKGNNIFGSKVFKTGEGGTWQRKRALKRR